MSSPTPRGPSAASSSGPAAAASSCSSLRPSVSRPFARSLNRLIHVPFKFEFSGSQIIFYDQEEDYSAEERARAGQSVASFRELMQEQT